MKKKEESDFDKIFAAVAMYLSALRQRLNLIALHRLAVWKWRMNDGLVMPKACFDLVLGEKWGLDNSILDEQKVTMNLKDRNVNI